MSDTDRPEPATHGETVAVGEYEIAPGAQLSQETQGPIGASEYTSFVVLDVDPDAETLELCRMTDYERRTVTASNLASVIGVNTFVVNDGRDADDETDAEGANAGSTPES